MLKEVDIQVHIFSHVVEKALQEPSCPQLLDSYTFSHMTQQLSARSRF